MARTPWVLDGRGIAYKVKNAGGLKNWRSDASIECPKCNYIISNAHVSQEWPGLPAGVKFDPSDQELLEHLAAKVGVGNVKPHAFINEFIITLEENNGICYTHPENLPGVKKDGGSIHFFHKTIKAYTTGGRKRRKIASDVHGGEQVGWHKTGKTKPIIENGIQKGCKKIMVLYVKGSKAEKTNWVMHQYHLGIEEDEREGEFVVSKVFYQQQSKCDRSDPDIAQDDARTSTSKGDPLTPKTSTPLPPRSKPPHACLNVIKEEEAPQAAFLHATIHPFSKGYDTQYDSQKYIWNASLEDSIWPAGESQFLEDSQELMNHSLFCSEMFENQYCQQSVEANNSMLGLAECGRIVNNESKLCEEDVGPPNSLPKSCEDGVEASVPKSCQESVEANNSMDGLSKCTDSTNSEPEKELNTHIDPALANIELDTPPDGLITFSQFSSSQEQDTESLLGWINSELGLVESQSQ